MIKLIDIIGKLSRIDAFLENEGSNRLIIYDREEFMLFIKKELIWDSGSTPVGYLGNGTTGSKMFRGLKLKKPKYLGFHNYQLKEHHLTITSVLKKEIKDIKIECVLEKHTVDSYFNTEIRPKYCKIKIYLD